MKTYSYIFLTFICVPLCIYSCSIFKERSKDTIVIRGEYKIVKQEKVNTVFNDSSFISGFVLDKKEGIAIVNAIVQIDSLKKETLTKENGYFELAIPKGIFKLRIIQIGYSKLETKLIKFDGGYKSHLRFELGTTIIY